MPFVSAFRGTLLVLLVGSALAVWLIVRPPGLPSDTSSVVEPLSPQEPELGGTLTQAEAPSETIAFPLPSPATPAPTVVATPAPTPISTPTSTATPTPQLTSTPTPTEDPTSTEHTVQVGDTLGTIADAFGTTVDAIVALNGFASESITLQIGQTITIPLEPVTTASAPTPGPSSTEYTVQAGDTLFEIADAFGTTVDAIVALNGFTSESITLQIGQTITIPLEPVTTASTPTPGPSSTEYTVQAGDTLGKIARDFGTTVDAIVALNGFTSESITLQIGQTITIPLEPATTASTPTPGPSSTEYTVQAGDTLGKIARDFGTTVDAIVALNGFASESVILQIGQTITIPLEP